MKHYAGLDVSVKETSMCIVDETGRICREGKVATHPDDLLALLADPQRQLERVGLEAGPLSQWLFSGLAEAGLPAICIETRHAKAFLRAQVNKSDRNDARGISQMMRVGLFRPVHVKTLASQKQRVLLAARKLLQEKAIAIENDIRGLLRNFGLKVGVVNPAVLAGVWDHSNFQADMHGRLRRTARFIAVTIYGDRTAAEATIARMHGIHAQVHGVLPDGTSYHANDPSLLAWVHATEAVSFLNACTRYAEPGMSRRDQDRYFGEVARLGLTLGADPVPRTRAEAWNLIRAMRPQLRYDRRTRKVARLVLHRRLDSPAAETLHALIMQAGVDLLPDWARTMHGLSSPLLSRPLVRAGAFGMAETLRWAFQRT